MTGWRRTVTLLVVRNLVHGLTAITVAGLISLVVGGSLNLPGVWLLQIFVVLTVVGWLVLPTHLPTEALYGLVALGLVLIGAWIGSILSVYIFDMDWLLLIGMGLGWLSAGGLQKLYRRFGQQPLFTTQDST